MAAPEEKKGGSAPGRHGPGDAAGRGRGCRGLLGWGRAAKFCDEELKSSEIFPTGANQT